MCPVPGRAGAGSSLEAFVCLPFDVGPQSLLRRSKKIVTIFPQGLASLGWGWLCPQGAELGGCPAPLPFPVLPLQEQG